MRVRVGGAQYRASPCFMTLLRYRALFGASYLDGQGTDAQALARLVYAAIPPQQRPEYEDFARDAAADPLFAASALRLRGELLRPDRGPAAQQGASGPPPPGQEYEYALVSLFASLGFAASLLDELTMAQAVRLVQVALALRSPDARPRPMEAAERRKLYGITPEREARVRDYLRGRPEQG